jgi:hypothetical protein
MPGQTSRAFRPEPDDEQGKYVDRIQDIPKNQRLCRIRHMWPSEVEGIWPGEALPDGVNVVPYADGSGSQVVETCSRHCGKSRVFDTLEGNIIPDTYSFRYRQTKVWVTVDPDANITGRDIRRAMFTDGLRGTGRGRRRAR